MPVLDWTSLDITSLANATLGLLTGLIIWISVKVGRRTVAPAEPPATMKMEGVTVISSESLLALSRSIEGAILESTTRRAQDEKNRLATCELKNEIEELRFEMRLSDRMKNNS